MVKKQIKEIFDEKINKDRIYQNVINLSENKTNKKILYGILSTAAMVVICIVVVTNSKIGIEQKEKHTIGKELGKENGDIININEFSMKNSFELDASWRDADLTQEFKFLNNIHIPEILNKIRQGKIYVRENLEDDKYSKFNENRISYDDDSEEEGKYISINFSENELLPDCVYSGIEEAEESIIDDVKVKLFATEMIRHPTKVQGEAYFEYNGYKFNIEAYRITEEEFLQVVESVIKEFKREQLYKIAEENLMRIVNLIIK